MRGALACIEIDEFGQRRPKCSRFGLEDLEAYHDIVAKSESEEDYDGRLDLYELYISFCISVAVRITLIRPLQKIQYVCLGFVPQHAGFARPVSPLLFKSIREAYSL